VPEEYPRLQAPVAAPGKYMARLTVGGQSFDQPFEIKRDPRITATDADLEAQFELMIQIRDSTAEITDAVDNLRKLRQQLNGGDPAVLEKLRAIEGTLTRLAGTSPDMLPPKALNNRLAELSSAVQQADGRPTKQMYAVYQYLAHLTADQMESLDVLTKQQKTTLGATK
jgi:hypothetical protein